MLRGRFQLGLNYEDVLIVPEVNTFEDYTSRAQIDIISKKFPFEGIVPIIASNMSTIGTFEVAKVLSKFKLMTALHKYYTVQDFDEHYKDDLIVAVSSGMKDKDYFNLVEILDRYPTIKYINLDVANGYMKSFAKFVENVKEKYKDKLVIAGNVVTPDGVRQLRESGADIVKIGIGSGSVCQTRHKTGVGYPQLQAILDCCNYSHIIADGGIVVSGDIAKAFCAGADAVMIGSLFANTKETGNVYYGMSSTYAQKEFGCYAEYKASEGMYLRFDSEQPFLEDVVKTILGGLRSALSYCNSMDIDSFIGKQSFIYAHNIYNDKWKSNK